MSDLKKLTPKEIACLTLLDGLVEIAKDNQGRLPEAALSPVKLAKTRESLKDACARAGRSAAKYLESRGHDVTGYKIVVDTYDNV